MVIRTWKGTFVNVLLSHLRTGDEWSWFGLCQVSESLFPCASLNSSTTQTCSLRPHALPSLTDGNSSLEVRRPGTRDSPPAFSLLSHPTRDWQIPLTLPRQHVPDPTTSHLPPRSKPHGCSAYLPHIDSLRSHIALCDRHNMIPISQLRKQRPREVTQLITGPPAFLFIPSFLHSQFTWVTSHQSSHPNGLPYHPEYGQKAGDMSVPCSSLASFPAFPSSPHSLRPQSQAPCNPGTHRHTPARGLCTCCSIFQECPSVRYPCSFPLASFRALLKSYLQEVLPGSPIIEEQLSIPSLLLLGLLPGLLYFSP